MLLVVLWVGVGRGMGSFLLDGGVALRGYGCVEEGEKGQGEGLKRERRSDILLLAMLMWSAVWWEEMLRSLQLDRVTGIGTKNVTMSLR